jgi:hypothetical protein
MKLKITLTNQSTRNVPEKEINEVLVSLREEMSLKVSKFHNSTTPFTVPDARTKSIGLNWRLLIGEFPVVWKSAIHFEATKSHIYTSITKQNVHNFRIR